ncbi:MAG: glycosyltransferase, partial [Promethearchaeota archaeon]
EIPPMLVIPSGVFIKNYDSNIPLKKKTQGLLKLFYAGTIRPWKGVDTILLGVAKLTKMGNPVHLTILGGTEDDPDIWRLRQLISKLNIQENVTLKGYVPHNEVKTFMKECDLAILPYRRNLYNNYVLSPLKMFEFLAARMPMLIFDNPCIREIVKDKETAIIVKPDVESLVSAIIDIQKNVLILDEIAEKGNKIARYYDWHVRVKTIEAFLDRLERGELEPGQIVDRNDLLSESEIQAILQ